MNNPNNRQTHSKRPETRPNPGRASTQTSQKPRGSSSPRSNPKDERPASGIIIVIQLLMLAASLTFMSLFLSFLPKDFKFEYIHTIAPVTAAEADAGSPSGNISESEIPAPPVEPEPIVEPEPPTFTGYDYSQPVPEGEVHTVDYFNDTVFIGDSRTVGLIMYTKLSPFDYSAVGLSINLLPTKQYLRYTNEDGETETVTCLEALEREKGNYSSIYLALGLNELGWDANYYIKVYAKVVAQIREITDVPIYIQLIIPVTAASSEQSSFGITNEKAVEFNNNLRAYAEEQQFFLLDPTGLFALEDGSLDPQYASDGVHLTVNAYRELLAYYQCHVVEPDDYDEYFENSGTAE